MVSTGLTKARRFEDALALDPIPASKVQSAPLQIAELDKHNKHIPLLEPWLTDVETSRVHS
jgi:hypothetical protein